ncbi:MAG: hypothetical protein ACK55I_14380, partial [bacterium]
GRQIAHGKLVGGRAHAGRLHVIGRGAHHIKEPRLESGGVARLCHGQANPCCTGIGAKHQLGTIGGKAGECSPHLNGAPTRNGRVPRLHTNDTARYGCLGGRPGDKEQARR